MEKILSISIAAYNAEKDIANCLNSLINSKSFNQLDVIVVNDGSKDKTADIVNVFVDKYRDSIRLVNKANGGHGSTINASIKCACGKYYKILDSDDWVDSENLDKLVMFLKDTDVDMVLNPYDEISYASKTKIRQKNPCEGNLVYGKIYDVDELDDVVLYMHSLTFRRDVIQKMGPIIDENCFYVDMEYCIFPLKHVHSFTCLDYAVYQYLLGSQTQSMSVTNMIKRRDQHLKITKRIIDFYNSNVGSLEEKVKEAIGLRIKYAIYGQYMIYLRMPSREAKIEIVEFDRWLKKQSTELYEGPKGKAMKFIRFNRMLGYKLFIPALTLIRKLKLLE